MLPAARWHVGGKKYSNTVIFSSAYHFLYSTFRIQQQCMSDGKEQFGIFAAEVDSFVIWRFSNLKAFVAYVTLTTKKF